MVGDDIKDDRLLLSARFVSLLFFFLMDDNSTFMETPAAGRGHHSGHLENFLSRPRFKSGPVAAEASLCAKPPFTSLLW